jgi:hypothetical protein
MAAATVPAREAPRPGGSGTGRLSALTTLLALAMGPVGGIRGAALDRAGVPPADGVAFRDWRDGAGARPFRSTLKPGATAPSSPTLDGDG